MKEKILGLINHLEANPKILKVFFNNAEDWLFHEHPAFPEAKSREEVLALKESLLNEEQAVDEKKPEDVIEELTEKVAALEEDKEKLQADYKALLEEKDGLQQLVDELKKAATPKAETGKDTAAKK